MNPAIAPLSHDEDDFSYSQRLIDQARGGSLNKRAKLSVGEPTVSSVGQRTIDAILNTGVESGRDQIKGVGINAMWLDDPIGPSDYYIRTGKLEFGPAAPTTDFLYRPHMDINYTNGTATVKHAPQVGGTHYGDPKTDVYAFSMANNLDPMQFNIVKYVTRFRKKDGMKDLLKAKQTLERLIAHEEAK